MGKVGLQDKKDKMIKERRNHRFSQMSTDLEKNDKR